MKLEYNCEADMLEDMDDAMDDMFYHPGSNSSLRAGVRNKPCPTCGEENRLTDKDVKLGYQCDDCADRAEGFGD